MILWDYAKGHGKNIIRKYILIKDIIMLGNNFFRIKNNNSMYRTDKCSAYTKHKCTYTYKKHKTRNIIPLNYHMLFLMLLFSIIITMSSGQVAAKVLIQEINLNPVIYETEFINISFTASSNTSNSDSIRYEIYYEGNRVSTSNIYEEKTDYSYSGIYEYMIVAYDDESSDIKNVTIEVIDVPLEITIISPKNTEYFNNTIPILAYINQDVETLCDYEVSGKNGILSPNKSDIPYYTYMFNGTVKLNDGQYKITVSCNNQFDSSISETSFKVFAEPVKILSKEYSIDQNNGLHLNIETNYESECRYSLSNKKFSEMNVFSMTNNIIHKTVITGLSEGGHRIYLSCVAYNNVPSYESILVTVSTRPTATIIIDKSGVLRQGTYSVIVKTSKDVQNSPSLSYYFNDDTTLKTVSLTGSGSTWNGYIIIPDDLGNKIGTFKFSAIDFNGVTGNIITNGEIFLVDTIPPSGVEELQAIIEGDGVHLSWFYGDNDFENFNIYRSEGDHVAKGDLLKTLKDHEFKDKNVKPGTTYTYAVSAVDAAGNEGQLSDEIQIDIPIEVHYDEHSDNLIQTPVVNQLSKSLYPLVDEKISEIEVMILDVDSMQKKMNTITDDTSLKIISLLDLDSKIKSSKSSLENILSQIKELKNQDLTKSDLEVRLNRLRLEAIKAQSIVLEELIIEEKGSFEQITQEADVESAAGYFLEGINISKSQLREYLKANKALQDNIIVKTESISFKMRNLNQENYEKKTLIHKLIIPSNTLSGVNLIEIIPKEVENTASEIEYVKTSHPEIIKNDPVVKWEYSSSDSLDIYYLVNDIVPLTSLKNIKTVVLTKPDFKLSENKITGMVSFETIQLGALSTIHWIIIVGIGVILVLGAYFVVLDRQDKDHIKKYYNLQNNVQNVGKNNINSGSVNKHSKTIYNDYPVDKIASVKMPENQKYQNKTVRNDSVSKDIQNIKKEGKKLPALSALKTYLRTSINTSLKNDSSGVGIFGSGTDSNSLKVFNIPEDIIRKIEYCNSVINMMQYERARTIYNETISAMPQIIDMYSDVSDSEPIKKLSHVKTKLEAYVHIHNARRHLYYKRFDKFSECMDSLNKCYGNIAYNVGFMQYLDNSSEIRFLNFIADNIKQLEAHREKINKLF